MYMPDAWGVVYKIDVRSGTFGRIGLEDGPRPGEDRTQPRRRAVGQSRHLGHRPRRPRHRHRQGHRQDRLGQEAGRPAGHDAQRRAARAQGRNPGRRLGRRPGRARLARRARSQDRHREVADVSHPGARRARQRDLEGQEQRLADRRRRVLCHRLLRSRRPTSPIGAPAIRRRNTIRPIVPATTSTPTARSPSTPRPARSSGSTSTRRTTRWTTTRPARTSSSTPRSTARSAKSSPTPAATASITSSTARTASSSRPRNMCRR